ncbi:MAG: hypothetical protein NTZ64_14505, partial [Polaromonas sp.]|nr:hypothetical protein [Polaromonas sp.]
VTDQLGAQSRLDGALVPDEARAGGTAFSEPAADVAHDGVAVGTAIAATASAAPDGNLRDGAGGDAAA